MYIHVPTLLRIKAGVISQLGKYLSRNQQSEIVLFFGEGIERLYGDKIFSSLKEYKINVCYKKEILDNRVETVFDVMGLIPNKAQVIVAVGGGKVVDYAKYISFLKKLPFLAVPTALSNDGMASPTASLTHQEKRKSFKAKSPEGVLIDTDVILQSPERYTYSGIGDMISKITALLDWKQAFHKTGELVNDFSVLVAEQSIENVLGSPSFDVKNRDFISRLAGSLVMSGVAMEICGTSRPASGAEHLISHAYDELAKSPSLHGLQVGVASYATSYLQDNRRKEVLAQFLLLTGFARHVEQNPLSKSDFLKAIQRAPELRNQYYTILSSPGALERLTTFCHEDELMKRWLKD